MLNQTYDNITEEYQQSGEQSHNQNQAQNQSPEQMMVNAQTNGRSRITTIATQTAKERFYKNVEHHRKQAKIENVYKEELDALKERMQLSAPVIVTNLMGEPNKKLTNSSTYRYGDKGSMAITITGEKAGTWYDFEEGKGGDLISLVSRQKACDFKQSIEYIKEQIGNYRRSSLQLVSDHDVSNKYIDHLSQVKRDQAARAAKERITQDLYNRSKNIEQGSVAARYLAEARGINCDLSADIKTTSILDLASGKRFPAIVAFARDSGGTITGGQQLLLDPATASKADVEVPKKSFGKIAGSFVEIAVTGKNTEHDHHNLTIIAEGLETALSIKQAGTGAKILCSLGISNIKNYSARQGEKIIIAADHDRTDSITNQTIVDAQYVLSANAMVRVVRPIQLGDFNDILQQQGSIKGKSEIRAIFAPAINDLGRYSKKEVAIIADYEQLEGQSSNIDLFLAGKQQSCDDLLKFNPKYDIAVIREKMIGLKDRTREELLKHELCKEMKPCVVNALEQFKKDKLNRSYNPHHGIC